MPFVVVSGPFVSRQDEIIGRHRYRVVGDQEGHSLGQQNMPLKAKDLENDVLTDVSSKMKEQALSRPQFNKACENPALVQGIGSRERKFSADEVAQGASRLSEIWRCVVPQRRRWRTVLQAAAKLKRLHATRFVAAADGPGRSAGAGPAPAGDISMIAVFVSTISDVSSVSIE
jgi:hypothetical protein